MLHSFLHRIFETFSVFICCEKAVDYNFDVVNFVPVHFHVVGNFAQFTIHPYMQVAFFADLLE